MRTVISEPIDERTTPIYTATIRDATGTAVPLDQLTALTLSLWNQHTGTVLNGRDAQDVLNLNGVTVHPTSGALTWTLSEEDTTIEDPDQYYEPRVAQFIWSYSGGTKRGAHEVLLTIRNLQKVS